MVTYYNKKDLIKFGQYLLSEERENRLKQSDIENPNGVSYEERKRQVHDVDFFEALCSGHWKEPLVSTFTRNVKENIKIVEDYLADNADRLLIEQITAAENTIESLKKTMLPVRQALRRTKAL